MKRALSLVLAATLVLGSVPAGFAATASAGETLKGYGVVAGDQNGSLNEDKTITRAEMMTVLARLLGKYEEASKYSIPSTSKDVAGHWNAKVIAFAEKEGWTAGKGNGMFDPNGTVTLQEAAAFMVKALGYTVDDYAKVVEQATKLGLLKDVASTDASAKVLRSDVFTAALNTLNTAAKDSTVVLGEKLGYFKAETAELAVSKTEANSAKSFQVTFNTAVADTAKITFAAKRETTPVATTVSWNDAKTVATLTGAAKFSEGDYSVEVTDNRAEKAVVMSTAKVTIKKEEVTKVEYASDTIARISDFEGVIRFKVYNQYNEDITDSALSRSLSLSSSADSANIDYKTGVITVKKESANNLNNLRDVKVIVITLNDTSTGFVSTKTLNVSDSVSAISEVKINGVVNEKGEAVDFVYGTAKQYYLDITVLDQSGNEVTSKKVLSSKNNDQEILKLNASNGITLEVVDHPTKSGVAAYRIDWGTFSKPSFDTPVTFTAIAPYATSGKNNSTFTATLKREAKVETFKLFAPAETVSLNRTTEIPFEAYDQNGNKVTEYADIAADGALGKVKISGVADDEIQWLRQSDGGVKLYFTPKTTFTGTSKTYYLSATVENSLTGSYSQISIDVKNSSKTTAIDAYRVGKLFTPGAKTGKIRLSNLSVRDEYDRKINLRDDKMGLGYYVVIKSNNTSAVGLTTDNGATTVGSVTLFGDQSFKFIGGGSDGVATITYELWKNGKTTYEDTATAVLYNIKVKDVTKIQIKPEDKKILMLEEDRMLLDRTRNFANALNTAKVTDIVADGDWHNNELDVYGLTSAGDEVLLSEKDTDSAHLWFSSSNSDFTVAPGVDNGSMNDPDHFIATGDFQDNVNSASTVITAYYSGANAVLSATTTVEAVREKPVANKIYVFYDHEPQRTNIIDVTNNVVTVSKENFASRFEGKSVLEYTTSYGGKFDNAGMIPTAYAPFYFCAESKFGEHYLTDLIATKVSGTGTLTIDKNSGNITTANIAGDEEFVITGITSNGQTTDVRLKITGTTTNAATNILGQIQAYADADNANSLTVGMLTDLGIKNVIVDNIKAYRAAVVAKTAAEITVASLQVIVDTANGVTVKSVPAVTATTTVGTQPSLPATAKVTLSDGTTKDLAVAWGTVDVATAGTKTVEGTLTLVTGVTNPLNVKVSATVTVTELPVGNVLNATFTDGMFGKYVEFTMPAGQTKITSATLNGTALSAANFDYGVTGTTGTVNVKAKTDVVKVTIAGTEYTLVIK